MLLPAKNSKLPSVCVYNIFRNICADSLRQYTKGQGDLYARNNATESETRHVSRGRDLTCREQTDIDAVFYSGIKGTLSSFSRRKGKGVEKG